MVAQGGSSDKVSHLFLLTLVTLDTLLLAHNQKLVSPIRYISWYATTLLGGSYRVFQE